MILLLAGALLLTQGPTDSLTLAEAQASARAHRGSLRIAAGQVAEARGAVRLAGTIPNPVGQYSYTEDTPRQHVSLEQSLDWLLTRGPDRAAAVAGVARAGADSAQAAADLAADVRSAYFRAIAAAAVRDLTREQLELADSLVRLANERLARGDIALQEQEQLSLEAIRAGQRRSQAEQAAAIATTRLAQAIGRSAADHPTPVSSLDDGLEAALPLPFDRPGPVPSVAAAEADSLAAASLVRRARLAGAPLPSLLVGADWDDPGASHTPLAVVGVTIPLPFWHQGRGQVAVADAQLGQRTAALAEARLFAGQAQAETAIRLRETTRRAVVARDSLIPLARRIRSRAAAAYRAGETGLVLLLEALRAERDVAAESIDELLGWQEARAEWYRVRGVVE